jgi:hypothetical protein
VLPRGLAKSFPVTLSGFEIEAELAVHALDLKIATGADTISILTQLRTNPDGHNSPVFAAFLSRPRVRN